MHILVFGATGAIGLIFCQLAITKGHRLTLFVRSPEKLPQEIYQHSHVQVLEGQLDDEASLEEAAACGATVFISFAGPSYGTKGTPLTDGYKAMVPKLAAHNFQRVIVLCTPSFRDVKDQVSLMWRFGGWFMRTFSPGQYWEMIGVGNFVSSLPTDSEMKWTLFRVGGLRDDVSWELPIVAEYLGGAKEKMWISRRSVALWAVGEISDSKWLGEAPYIYNS
ncbi:hypothetical protein FE257_008537 [Aspergillus nanangensis]|uniref:NAD(P)-binding domain-containing protein n=1 Tax=Aspergillus nanangensis TaxID=2582783 RepID=A0AAD4CL92_ASPNN|nr:hypothetical protein FE257_008537 [Aspergillus nanangensis]